MDLLSLDSLRRFMETSFPKKNNSLKSNCVKKSLKKYGVNKSDDDILGHGSCNTIKVTSKNTIASSVYIGKISFRNKSRARWI